MSLFRNRILHTLAALAVAAAQVLGVQRGYLCDCHGIVVATEAEHCHHHMEDGEKPDFTPCAGDSHDECPAEDTEHHEPIIVKLNASKAGLTLACIPAFVAVLVAEIPAHDWMHLQSTTTDEKLSMLLDTGGESPPASVQVARCMVMLV